MVVDGPDDDSDRQCRISLLMDRGTARCDGTTTDTDSRRRFLLLAATTLPQLGPVRETVATDRRASVKEMVVL